MVKTIPATKRDVDNAESFANSAILSIVCYTALLVTMFLAGFWVILIVAVAVFVFGVAIVYSRLSVASAPACKGPILCSFFVFYALLTQPASMPLFLGTAIELIVGTMSLVYIGTSLDILFILQVIMMFTPSLYAMDTTMHKGLLPVLSFIILYLGYVILSMKTNLSFSLTHAYMITIPVFKASYIGLIIYMALCVMLHSLVAFRANVFDPTSDEEDEETGSEPIPDPPQPAEEPSKVTVPEKPAIAFIPRPRLQSVAAPAVSGYELNKMPLRSYASTPPQSQTPTVSNQTSLAKEEKVFGSIFMQHYGKS